MRLLAAPLLVMGALAACATATPVMIIVPGSQTRYAREAPSDPGCRRWGTDLDEQGNTREIWVCPPPGGDRQPSRPAPRDP